MSVLALAIFAFCSWAVFTRHFADGIIAKHMLVFSAITAFLVIVDHQNFRALLVSSILLVGGVLYAYFRPTRKRPLFIDRRVKPRPH